MESKTEEMKKIYDKLSDKNKDILILVARSVKVAQEEKPDSKLPKQG